MVADPPISESARLALSRSLDRILGLQRLEVNWNGYGAAKPDPLAIFSAAQWTADLYAAVAAAERAWETPNATASADGDVVLEWWNGLKKLTVYFDGRGHAEYVKSWGRDIESEMEEGDASTDAARLALWAWLTT